MALRALCNVTLHRMWLPTLPAHYALLHVQVAIRALSAFYAPSLIFCSTQLVLHLLNALIIQAITLITTQIHH